MIDTAGEICYYIDRPLPLGAGLFFAISPVRLFGDCGRGIFLFFGIFFAVIIQKIVRQTINA